MTRYQIAKLVHPPSMHSEITQKHEILKIFSFLLLDKNNGSKMLIGVQRKNQKKDNRIPKSIQQFFNIDYRK